MGTRSLVRDLRPLSFVLIALGLVLTQPGTANAQKADDEPCVPGNVPIPKGSKQKRCAPSVPARENAQRNPTQRAARKGKAQKGPIAYSPGFRMLPDGSSRVFVELNEKVTVQEIKSQGSISYVLTGVRVPTHNNRHTLMTHYFNTPVSGVRLVQGKDDARLVVDLRTPATATSRVVELTPGRWYALEVDFPAGAYVSDAIRDPAPPAAKTQSGTSSKGKDKRPVSPPPAPTGTGTGSLLGPPAP